MADRRNKRTTNGNRRLLIILIVLVAVLAFEAVVMLLLSGNRNTSNHTTTVAVTESPLSEPSTTPPLVATPTEAPTPTPEMTPEPTPELTPSPTPVETETPKNGFKVAIDAGHQLHSDSSEEPIGPGSSTTKPKVSSGTAGVSTGVPEYQLNLDIAKKLRKELIKRGYDVYMIRTKNDVHISNVERAEAANDSGADISIRLHADGIEDSGVRGTSALYPTTSNPYVSHLSKASKKLSQCILDAYCEKTGFANRGLSERDDLTGTNWSEIPVALLEMGFMSNATEDELMQEKSVQKKMAVGIADGIDDYFGI